MAAPFYNVFDTISAAVKTAWSPTTIFYGKTPILGANAKVAIIKLVNLEYVSGVAQRVTYRYNFEVTGRFPYPASAASHLETEKLARANELFGALITGPNFANVGNLARVDRVDFNDFEDNLERAYDLTVTFSFQAEAART